MKLSDFILITTKKAKFGNGHAEIKPRIICKDGFSLSVQCGGGNYSTPRDISKHYESVEIGFPSKEEKLISCYAEEHNDYTNTIYGWVPVEVVEAVIEKHGGINKIQTFKNHE